MTRIAAFAAALSLAATPLLADEVTDTLSSALQAYEEGDIDYAIEELDYAKSLMRAMKTTALERFLPEPPAGYTVEVDTDVGTGMAMLGGGVGTFAGGCQFAPVEYLIHCGGWRRYLGVLYRGDTVSSTVML